jgi:hypothetical protein
MIWVVIGFDPQALSLIASNHLRDHGPTPIAAQDRLPQAERRRNLVAHPMGRRGYFGHQRVARLDPSHIPKIDILRHNRAFEIHNVRSGQMGCGHNVARLEEVIDQALVDCLVPTAAGQ